MTLPSQPPTFVHLFHHALFSLCIMAWLAGCGAQERRPVEGVNGAVVVPQSDAVSLEGWKGETFALPPSFAPELPTGTESLLFSPGWRDPRAEGFWSYAFVMRINEPAPDAARIHDILERYYNGLMGSFAAGQHKDISGTPARIDVLRTAPNRYEARMHLIDCFATFQPIELRILIDAAAEADARSTLRIQVSPQPPEHAIWRSLNAATESILSREAGAHVKAEETRPAKKD